MSICSTLPEPDAISLAHSHQLRNLIVEKIQQTGPISFQEYMRMALYQPGLGYYSAGAQKFGEAGDFVTAPEISPLFSWCLAKQCQQIMDSLENPSVILELGAGSGVMALEILRELERRDALPDKYFILEVSADLRQRQQQLFNDQGAQFLACVRWLDELPKEKIHGVTLANEVMDAMPVHCFRYQAEFQQVYVDFQQGEFCWHYAAVENTELKRALESLPQTFSDGYFSEINLLLQPWIKSLADCLQQGVILLIDYGYSQAEYYHADRTMGTLMCHYRQRAHDNPLIWPGIQDITASVDFTAVAEAAEAAHLEFYGYTHQAGFLINCDIMAYAQSETDALQQYQLSRQIKKLTLPGEMGERFKVMALTSAQFDADLMGFASFDLSDSL